MRLCASLILFALLFTTSEAFVTPVNMPMMHSLHTSAEHRSVSQLFSVSSPVIRMRKRGDTIEDEWRIQGTKKSLFLTKLFTKFSRSNVSIGRILPWSFVGITLLTGVAHAASTVTVGSTMMPAATTAAALPAWQLVVATLLLMAQSFGGSIMNLASIGLQNLAVWYMAQLSSNPVVTKSVTAGVIGIIGDYMAQSLEHKLAGRKTVEESAAFRNTLSIHGQYDSRRGLSILADGLFISGPLMHLGYEFFESVLPSGSSSLAALSHVVADSVLLDSIFVATTFLVTGLMEGYRLKHLFPQFKSDYVPALKASWLTSLLVFPLEFVCFRYLPLAFRVLAVNFIDVIWDGVISFMAHRSRKDHGHRHTDTEAQPAVIESAVVGAS